MIQHGSLKEYVKKGIARSKELTAPVLVSQVTEIKSIDPLLFFAAGENETFGTRSFWATPTLDTVIVGLGEAFTINQKTTSERFPFVEQSWKEFLKNALLIEDYAPYGTGPLLLGGFSFDPLKPKTVLWEDFPDVKFVLPQLMLSIINGKSFLTINVVCNSDLPTRYEAFEDFIKHIENINSKHSKQVSGYKRIEVEPTEWMESVRSAAEKVQNGVVEKVVLAREMRLQFESSISIESVLYQLKEEQAMSYLFAFEYGKSCFVGASPERLIKKEDQEFLTTCLAGSIRRGKTLSEDEQLENELLSDRKNLIEHDVVVQMIKSAMNEVCTSISSPDTPGIYKMRDIQHLYTPVKGIAKQGISLVNMVDRLHPTPALGGQPKQKAVEIIREIEVLDRGWYGSPVGWIDAKDNGEFAVAIRSGLVKGKNASLFAGCGIVGDSEPESEYKETMIKFKPMLSALGGQSDEK
ncbi:isochorismate synthase [Fredinandcohnia sp. 179-A 10B2 NHS]|uniref:isochorismate synthase n=1 Tax=Fredinandcohnia sp. 179-A 10B2 NHS TaxID=3235176 RepID=UPI0039A09B5B